MYFEVSGKPVRDYQSNRKQMRVDMVHDVWQFLVPCCVDGVCVLSYWLFVHLILIFYGAMRYVHSEVLLSKLSVGL